MSLLINSEGADGPAAARQIGLLEAPSGAPMKQPLRVLMLIDKMLRGGGAERAMVALATTLPRDRFDVMVATTRPASRRDPPPGTRSTASVSCVPIQKPHEGPPG